jgi:hypothetical protein
MWALAWGGGAEPEPMAPRLARSAVTLACANPQGAWERRPAARTYVIPSRDLVIVRLGERGSHDTDTRVSVWSGRAGEIDHEIVRRVLLAVDDVPYEDPGPYRSAGTVLPPLDRGILGDAQDMSSIVEGLTAFDCH